MADSSEFQASGVSIDKVRASKAGHAFHEAWAARSALELLLPHTTLMAITLEGFDQVDETELGIGAVEIADLVRYFGATDVARASRTEIVQFKYSIASAEKAVRAADLSSTLTKFAKTDAELRALHGNAHVRARVIVNGATIFCGCYSSYWPVDRSADGAVLAAGVKAAIRGKSPTLFDIAPSELLAIVSKSARARGPAAFARILKAKLAEPRHDGTIRRRRRKTGIEPKLRSDYAQTLSHRIEPLLKYARAVADIIRPPRHQSRGAMVDAALARMCRFI